MAGRRVRLTPNGYFVMVLQRRISLRRSSGVGCVRAVSWGRVSEYRYRFVGSRYYSQTAGVGHSGSQLGVAHPLHATLDNGYWRLSVYTKLRRPRWKLTSNAEGTRELCIERHDVLNF